MNANDQINHLFRMLLRIHKSLIDFQKLVLEASERRTYTPYDMLQFAFHHPEFEWLRKVSTIMADMDESTSDKKNPPNEARLKEFVQRLDDLFGEASPDSDFKKRLKVAVTRDQKLSAEVSDLRAMLAQHK